MADQLHDRRHPLFRMIPSRAVGCALRSHTRSVEISRHGGLIRGRGGTARIAAAAALLCCSTLAACDGGATAPSAAGSGPRATDASADKVTTEKITLKDEEFTLEVAASSKAIEKGLGERESIPDDGGMLFVFPDAQMRHFWMLDCVIDIDIIFVDAVGGVTAVHRMKADPQRPDETRSAYEARLRRYSSVSRAQFAIELQAGSLDRLGIKPGDRLTHIDWRQIRRHAQRR